MATREDDIGIWNDLGIVRPVLYNWTKFPVTANGANATLRANFTCNDWSKVNHYLLIRPRYQTANSNSQGQPIRVYPEQTSIIFEVPIPQDLQERSIYFRDFEVRKVLRWRRQIGITPDAIVDINLEELWG